MNKERKSNCPIHYALELFGDKWSLLIIRDIMFRGKRSFGDFITSEENIATNILSNRLKMLQEVGVLSKSPDPTHGSKSIYSLTQKGLDLAPILLEISVWSSKHEEGLDIESAFLERYQQDRTTVLEETFSRLKGRL